MSVARFGHVAIPQFEGVTPRPLRGVRGPAARCVNAAVGAVRGLSKYGSLNITEWLQPRNWVPTGKPRRGEISHAEPLNAQVRPMSVGKKRVNAPAECGGVRAQAPAQGLWR